jgi:hypothetical protein
MPTTFGVPDEQTDFASRNVAFLDVLPALMKRINELLAQRSWLPAPRGDDETEEEFGQRTAAQRLVFFLGRLVAEDFMEILLLCANGYGFAGLRLLRSMFEAVVTGLYVARHPDKATAFLGYHTIHERKFIKSAEAAGIDLSQLIPEAEQTRIEREYQATKDRYRQMKCPECDAVLGDVSWTKMDPIAMARELGLHQLAVQCYSYTTLQVHTTPTRLISRLEETQDGLRFRAWPQRKEADAAMVGAHICIAVVLNAHNEYFSLGISGLEAQFAATVERAWGPDPGWAYRPPESSSTSEDSA